VNLRIQHRTHYFYTEKVPFGKHQLMVRPREGHGLRMEKCSIDISPGHSIRWIRDLYENNVALVDFHESASELIIACDYILQTCEYNPFNFIIHPAAVEYPFNYEHDLHQELFPLIRNLYFRDEERLRQWLEQFWHPGKRIDTLDLLQQINGNIYGTFRYQRREERGVQSPAETLENNSGSCRDFAALFMEACRFLGLAARFVSGYMYSAEITGRMSMHAWAEVYLPGAGWIGFDPSWGILAASQYIPVAVSRHPENATPISGTYIGTSRVFQKCAVDLFVEEHRPFVPISQGQNQLIG
jgi:transglutaminase-like putative cysteine protease